MNDEVRSSLYSARGFYFITYTLAFITLGVYDNDLRRAIIGSFVEISFRDIIYLLVFVALFCAQLVFFFIAGPNPGILTEHPIPDIQQGEDYQTGYFIDGKHVEDNQDIKQAIAEVNTEREMFEKAKNDENPFSESPSSRIDTSQIAMKDDTNETLDAEHPAVKIDLSGRISAIEHISSFTPPPKRYCDICEMEQPYRTKHCKECNVCIRKYDHHCFWIGGCVGELNHRKFILFLLFKTLLMIMCFNICMSGYDYSANLEGASMKRRVKVFFIIFVILCVLFMIFTGILLFYHAFLILTNQTTWEHARRDCISYMQIYDHTVFPFDYGMKKNLKIIMLHGGMTREWILRHPRLIKVREGFNYCINEYYNCC